MQQVQDLIESIRAAGGRVTPQRIAVIEEIRKSDSHPTIDYLFDKVNVAQPSLSKKTVYQIVNDLAEIGAVSLVDVGTGQLRIDPYVEHSHDHFVCTKCKSVVDVPSEIKTSISTKIDQYGEINSIDTVYRGICKKCCLA